ncbi:hypothetical protein cypCar_00031981 [Cyprinus carpio]|nr:hypothetical protein cypCar_00031981 [Cyprinus carpio]
MPNSYLLLLLAAVSCIDCQVVLTQSEQSVVVAPGGSYKLTCACSGFLKGTQAASQDALGTPFSVTGPESCV